jgi:hypothetical protein
MRHLTRSKLRVVKMASMDGVNSSDLRVINSNWRLSPVCSKLEQIHGQLNFVSFLHNFCTDSAASDFPYVLVVVDPRHTRGLLRRAGQHSWPIADAPIRLSHNAVKPFTGPYCLTTRHPRHSYPIQDKQIPIQVVALAESKH